MPGYRALFAAVLILPLAACASGGGARGVARVSVQEAAPPPAAPVEAAPYWIQNGDAVGIKFLQNPELDAAAVVRPDGRITLALVGDVGAAGLTPAELRAAISERYKRFVAETGYGEILEEGDDLEIRFLYDPQLDRQLRIRPDGKISLPLVGEIQGAGLRPAELRQRLIEAYSKHIKRLDLTLQVGRNPAKKMFADERFISVALSKATEREVFVGGEVLSPRVVRFQGQQLTTLQAIIQAGGVRETGDLSRVVILRRGESREAEWIRTNLSRPLSGQSLQNDVALRAGDVVVVPRTGIAQLNLYVRQYIRDLLPLQSTFSVTVEAIGE